MIYFFIGTTAQLVKMAPLLKGAKDRGLKYRYIDSGQHPAGSQRILDMLGLAAPDLTLNHGEDLATIPTLFAWFFKLFFRFLFNPGWIRRELFPEPGICLIHGDTVTTLLGAFFARRVGVKVAHVEAGLRSWSYFHPFPEEIVRIICMHLSDLLFAPDETAEANLKKMKVRAKVVCTGANTILDTLRLIAGTPLAVTIPDKPYALLSCHRFELIYSRKRTEWLVEAIALMAARMRVVFPVHAVTENRLRKYGLWEKLTTMPNVQLMPPQKFSDFIELERNAAFVAADGGSIQEETCYMGIPCLIFRARTERGEGLKKTAVLAEFRTDVVRKFLDSYRDYRGDKSAYDNVFPSRCILDTVSLIDQPG